MVTSPSPWTQAVLSLDWWTDRLAQCEADLAVDPHDPEKQQRVDEARSRYDYCYAEASRLSDAQDDRDARDEWMDYAYGY